MLRAAMICGCEWCLDFGSAISAKSGVAEADLRELPVYELSDRFDERERLVLDYATGISRSPAEVSDELFEQLRNRFDASQLVELTNAIALENYRARFNWAFGIERQGFAGGSFCVPPAARRQVQEARS
jgi:alkylhydroperoxidase family enzyme